MTEFWATVENDQIPVCERCKGTSTFRVQYDHVLLLEDLQDDW